MDGFLHELWHNLVSFGAPDTTQFPVSLAEKILRPAIVYVLLVVGLRTFGKRVLAQLNPFDLVVLLTISNTVQNAIIGNDTSLLGGVVGAASLLATNSLLVRALYRGPKRALLGEGGRDLALILDGKLNEPQLARLRINSAELTVKAHERGFDTLGDVHTAVMAPTGSLYFRGEIDAAGERRHAEILARIEALSREVASLRK